LYFEKWYRKQNSVIRLKANISQPQLFGPSQVLGLATLLVLRIVRNMYMHIKTTCPDTCHLQKDYVTKSSPEVRIKKKAVEVSYHFTQQ